MLRTASSSTGTCFFKSLIVILQYNNQTKKIMGLIKSELFTTEQNVLAAYAKVLGHPARIAIVQYLLQQQQCVCGDLVQEIGLAQATISQHLKALKEAGLIQGTIAGTSVCYCLDPTAWQQVQQLLGGFINQAFKNSCC
jgi:DNA-binding HxlR family transcriptional regulator